MIDYLRSRWGEYTTIYGLTGAIVGVLMLVATLFIDRSPFAAISDAIRGAASAVLGAGLVAILMPGGKRRKKDCDE
jgi:predicted membrane protein